MDFIFDVTYLSYVVAVVLFCIFHRNNNIRGSYIILSYTIYSFINDIFTEKEVLKALLPSLPNTVPLAIFTIIEFLLLSYYLRVHIDRRVFKNTLVAGSLLFFIVAFFNLYRNTVATTAAFDTIPLAVSSIIILLGCIFYMFETIQKPEVIFVYSKKSFWVVVGIMIYFSGTFFLFLQFDNMSPKEQENFWIINLICFVLKNIFFSISFILKPENQQNFNTDHYAINDLK